MTARWLRRIALAAGGLVVAFVAGAWIWSASMKFEEPSYSVVRTLGAIEFREYAPYLVAEVTVAGSADDAGNQGFRILAKYIFGENESAKKMAMTAPVTQTRTEGTKMQMTAPVTQQQKGDKFVIQFVIESKYTLETVPEPKDNRVTIRSISARTLAVLRYSGTWSMRNYDKHLHQLRDELGKLGYRPIGEPTWSRYDPPFIPWFLKRNEIAVAYAPL